MKKTLSLMLIIALIFGLCACGSAGDPVATEPQPQAAVLQAGYGRENITPDHPVGMGGYSDSETRKSKLVMDYLYTTCVAFNEGDTTILVYTVDVCGLNDNQMEKIRSGITLTTGIPGENIFIGATHTHSAPAVGVEDAWDKMFFSACTEAAKTALSDLAPAQIHAGTAELENMNFVRHYLMNDGTYYGSNFGSTVSGYKAHAIDPDKQIVLLKLDRETKKDILMINWQSHPASAAWQDGYDSVTADFVGHTRSKLENETDMMVAYYTGASGNVANKSLIESENTNRNTDYREYGKILADKIIELLPSLTLTEGSGIQTTRLSYDAPIDHSWDHMIKEANEVYDLWKSVGKTEGDNLGKSYGFTSSYQARAIRSRYSKPATEPREMRAFRVGSIGFISGTYEMYCDHQMYVKEHSPFDITFSITGCSGYIPNKHSYEYRSYESDTSFYASGTGEAMAEEYVKLLNAIK